MKALSLTLVLLTGCATLEDRAYTAAVGDGVSTVGALALGAAEMNPLGPLAIAVKIPLLAYAATLGDEERQQFYAVAGPLWGAATANNVCVIVAILTGGIAAPACLGAAAVYGAYAWQAASAERDFYSACFEYRRHSGEAFRCVYRG